MTSTPLVQRWQRRLLALGVSVAVLYAIGAGAITARLGLWLGGTVTQAWVLAGLVAVGVAAWRARRAGLGRLHASRVALWLDEQLPALEYAVQGTLAGSTGSADRIRASHVEQVALRRAFRALLHGVGVTLAGAAVLVLMPARSGSGIDLSRPTDARRTSGIGVVSVRVSPPTYTGMPSQSFESPDLIHPMVASRVELTGRGAAPDVRVGARTVDATARGGDWVATFTVDTVAALVTVARDSATYLLALDPVRDALPQVELELPARDTVMRAAPRAVGLRAVFRDDIGLDSTRFEYIVTSGDGERFTFKRGELQPRRDATTRVSREVTWELDPLALQPGDVVHMRAIASDRRGQVAASDTRALRIARASEADSLAVDAAPPAEVDGSVISQRMLINLTEALVRRSRSIAAANLRAESARIGRDQARLRRQVSDLIFARLGDDPGGEHFHGDGHEHGEQAGVRRALTPDELLQTADRATGARGAMIDATHEETPVVAVSRPLLEAYNAMWDAGRELESGAPRAALPSMYAALAAIQKARAAERLYLRGATRAVVVDLARVRLSGKERGSDFVTAAVPRLTPVRQAVWQRIVGALARGDAARATDSLLVLRVEMAGEPALAAAIDTLVAGVRGGRDVTETVQAVRARLGAASAHRAVTSWRPVP